MVTTPLPESNDELLSLQRQLDEARANLRLIKERKAEFVRRINIPLQLIKDERDWLKKIAELERQIAALSASISVTSMPEQLQQEMKPQAEPDQGPFQVSTVVDDDQPGEETEQVSITDFGDTGNDEIAELPNGDEREIPGCEEPSPATLTQPDTPDDNHPQQTTSKIGFVKLLFASLVAVIVVLLVVRFVVLPAIFTPTATITPTPATTSATTAPVVSPSTLSPTTTLTPEAAIDARVIITITNQDDTILYRDGPRDPQQYPQPTIQLGPDNDWIKIKVVAQDENGQPIPDTLEYTWCKYPQEDCVISKVNFLRVTDPQTTKVTVQTSYFGTVYIYIQK